MTTRRTLLEVVDAVNIGKMHNEIKIIDRAIDPEVEGYTMDFTDFTTLYAGIKTTSGVSSFNNVNILDDTTHLFYIRYGICDVGKNYTIEYDSKYYNVLTSENLGELNRFILIQTVQRGVKTNNANWA